MFQSFTNGGNVSQWPGRNVRAVRGRCAVLSPVSTVLRSSPRSVWTFPVRSVWRSPDKYPPRSVGMSRETPASWSPSPPATRSPARGAWTSPSPGARSSPARPSAPRCPASSVGRCPLTSALKCPRRNAAMENDHNYTPGSCFTASTGILYITNSRVQQHQDINTRSFETDSSKYLGVFCFN